MFLASCGILFKDSKDGAMRNRGKDYLLADRIKEIEVPEGIQSNPMVPLYPIVDVQTTDDFGDNIRLEDYDIPRPNPLGSDDATLGVKIQRLGNERWVALGASTSQVWPHTQSFLSGSNIDVARSDAGLGLIETDWLQYTDDTSIKARFKISLEKGIHAETSEVHITEMELPMDSEVPEGISWPDTSTDPSREEWLLRELANHLARNINSASASLLGLNVGGDEKVGYLKGAPEPTMSLRVSPARTWATVTHAANQNGFLTWESDERSGIIYAGYSAELAEEKGFWGKMFSFGRQELAEEARYSLSEIMTHLSGAEEVRRVFSDRPGVAFDDALKKADEGFLIVVTDRDDHSEVIVRDHRGRQIDEEESKTLLRLLRNNLI